jgi:hypothetical protein
MNNNAPRWPTEKMESAIRIIQEAIRLYNRGIVKQPGHGQEEYMEEVKSYLHGAVADINYAYGMIEPMPAGEPLVAVADAGNVMKENIAGGKRRKSTCRQRRQRRKSKRV